MTTPSGSDRRPPQRSLTEQAMETGMQLLSKVDPKLLASAGSFLLKSQAGRRPSPAQQPTPGGLDLSGVARQLGALLAEVGALRDQPQRAPSTAPQRPWPSALQKVSPDALLGEPTIPGTASGTARVATGGELPAGIGAGDVLVCRSLPNSWSPLLGSVAGVVFETGGVASAAMRACRTAGIPAVRLAKATELVADGTTVTIDGGTGRVRR